MPDEKLIRLADEYLIDFNVTRAAGMIGVSVGTATKYLKKAEVVQYMQAKQKDLQNTSQIKLERVIEEYRRIAFGDVRQLYNEKGTLKEMYELTEEEAAMIDGLEVEELYDWFEGERVHIGRVKKLKRTSKIAALDALARHLGMFEKDNDQKRVMIAVKIN
jgi:phage terminase small subunit